MKRLIYLLLAVTLVLTGCGRKNNKKTAGNADRIDIGQTVPVQTGVPAALTSPWASDPPASITDPLEREVYVVEHYWDYFNFKDPYGEPAELVGTELANYVYQVERLGSALDKGMISGFMRKAEASSKFYIWSLELLDEILSDPNSVLRDNELHIEFLEDVLGSKIAPDYEKARATEQLKSARKNRVGEKAVDFTYMVDGGKRANLYGIEADYTVIFIYNLGCNACGHIREVMLDMFGKEIWMGDMYESGRLKILAVYPDKDIDGWYKYKDDIPAGWINAYENTGRLSELYDIPAIPSLYLLDKDKKVILRDFTDMGQMYLALAAAVR